MPAVDPSTKKLALASEALGLGASRNGKSLASLQSDAPRSRLPLLMLPIEASWGLSLTCVTTMVHSHPTPTSHANLSSSPPAAPDFSAGNATRVRVGTSSRGVPRPS